MEDIKFGDYPRTLEPTPMIELNETEKKFMVCLDGINGFETELTDEELVHIKNVFERVGKLQYEWWLKTKEEA